MRRNYHKIYFYITSIRRHTIWPRDWSSDVCSSDLSEKFGFELTTEEAKQIISYLKRTNINPFSQHDRLIMLQALADITDQATAHQANDLFIEVIKSYGVEHLFEA